MRKYILKYPFGFFILLAAALRFFSFFPSVIDHDESTYLQIGKELLDGKKYFIDVIDVKPPGIFYVTAVIQAVFGDSIFLFRLLCSVLIAFTSFLLFRLKFKLSGSSEEAVAAGVLYILMLSVYTYYGISANTELFTNLLAVSALLLFVSGLKGSYFFAGLLLGIGFIIKHSVVFDYLAFGSFFLFSSITSKKITGSYLLQLLSSFAAFILPFLLVVFYYYSLGRLNTYLFYTFRVPAAYPVERETGDTLLFVLDFLLRFFPFSFFFFIVLFKGKVFFNGYNFKALMITWCCFVLFAVLYSGQSFGHYFIQIYPPFVLLASGFFNRDFHPYPFISKIKKTPVITGLLILICGTIIFFQKKDYYDKPDMPLQISRFLKKEMMAEDLIYVHGYHQIVYYLVDKPSLNKYVHRSILFNNKLIDAMDIDTDEVAGEIIKANPRFIVECEEAYFGKLEQYKDDHYQLVKTFTNNKPVKIYKRRD